MTGRAARLARLASAQGELAELLEARLARKEVKARELQNLIVQLTAALESSDAALLAVHAAGLKRLSEAGAALLACRAEADAIRQELLGAREREKRLTAKGISYCSQEERKAREAEALETALHMATKACRKPGVLR